MIPFLSAQNMHTLAFTDVWADATNFQSLPVPTYINLNLSFSTPPSAPHSTTTRKADRSTHILTAISNHRTNSLTALTVSSPTMYDRPDFPLMSQASEEALRKLYQFKMQNALQVTAGIPGHSPSPKPPALAPPPRPQFAYYPPADGVRSPSRPHTTPAALSVHPYNRYDAHCLKRQQQEQQRLQQQRDGRCLYPPPSHMPTIVSQPPATCPYIPRIYPEPLTCITREMVFDRVYLLLLEHLTKRWAKNPNPLIYISSTWYPRSISLSHSHHPALTNTVQMASQTASSFPVAKAPLVQMVSLLSLTSSFASDIGAPSITCVLRRAGLVSFMSS